MKSYTCLFFHIQMTENKIRVNQEWKVIRSEEEIGYIDVKHRDGERENR